jgi:hypothetical protein
MNRDLIRNQLNTIGRTVYLKDGDWVSMPFKACITHLWRKKSSSFESEHSELGKTHFEYYLYTGPYDHDITVITDDGVLELDGKKYEFKCADAVSFGDQVVYYTGILKRLRGDEYDEA